MSAQAAEALTALLAAYADPALEQAGGLVDVPVSAAGRPSSSCRSTWPAPGSTSSSHP
jgi:hypothetical protein